MFDEYRTRSLYTAAALVAVGTTLIRTEPDAAGKAVFVFPDNDGATKALVRDYHAGAFPHIQARALYGAMLTTRAAMFAATDKARV